MKRKTKTLIVVLAAGVGIFCLFCFLYYKALIVFSVASCDILLHAAV